MNTGNCQTQERCQIELLKLTPTELTTRKTHRVHTPCQSGFFLSVLVPPPQRFARPTQDLSRLYYHHNVIIIHIQVQNGLEMGFKLVTARTRISTVFTCKLTPSIYSFPNSTVVSVTEQPFPLAKLHIYLFTSLTPTNTLAPMNTGRL